VGAVSEPGRLGQVQAYYDRLAPRLVAVEARNWHLQSRMALVLETIDRHARAGGRVLDVGCGTGFLLERLAGRGYSGIGVDLSPESVAHASRRLAEIGASDRLSAVVGSANDPPEGPSDLVCLTDVLEHLEDPRACLQALARGWRQGAWSWSRRPTGAASRAPGAGSPSTACRASA
jgi:2-polyprenyl-3-methyl-5-hydroxy-6-metoxy-1,4-benzoquinol methylase